MYTSKETIYGVLVLYESNGHKEVQAHSDVGSTGFRPTWGEAREAISELIGDVLEGCYTAAWPNC